jgi:hypothetical protein
VELTNVRIIHSYEMFCSRWIHHCANVEIIKTFLNNNFKVLEHTFLDSPECCCCLSCNMSFDQWAGLLEWWIIMPFDNLIESNWLF